LAEIKLEGITKKFGSVYAVNEVDLVVRDREFFTILGPSGAGKTTILRLIAGLEKADKGRIFFDDSPIDHLPPAQRKVKMVFQDYALWPHMQVFKRDRYSNLSFGLRLRQWLAEEIEQRVEDVARKVGIDRKLYRRRPKQLSEGEKQRVAIGRAITIVPNVLLMDDPMTNLDPQSKLKVRKEIRQLHEDLGTTTIYVTHHLPDAMALSDRMGIMREGRFEQINTPKNIYSFPSNDFVRDFIESAKISVGY
jgi:ABC-type sugar transport system ATPase subunit